MSETYIDVLKGNCKMQQDTMGVKTFFPESPNFWSFRNDRKNRL